MRIIQKQRTILAFIVALLVFSCSKSEKPATEESTKTTIESTTEAATDKPVNKGVGPISSLVLGDKIDMDMAAKGLEVFEAKCTACHRADRKFIGPSPAGILERRSPEWVMNMILDPEKMVAEDPDAKALLLEFNGSPMANQNLTEEEARAVLEYFRIL